MEGVRSDVIPYRYQEEVFRRAQKGANLLLDFGISHYLLNLSPENIIAALNTGSGKTLISILLIKWIASQEKSNGKAIIFLVPKVTLVEQQSETIREYTSLRVAKFHGAIEIDLSNRARWKKQFKSHDAFVMTGKHSNFC